MLVLLRQITQCNPAFQLRVLRNFRRSTLLQSLKANVPLCWVLHAETKPGKLLKSAQHIHIVNLDWTDYSTSILEILNCTALLLLLKSP